MRKKWARAISAASVFVLLAGCGQSEGASGAEGDGLASEDPKDVVAAWSEVACGAVEVREQYDAASLAAAEISGDLSGAANCDLEVTGTLMQKRQMIFVFNSEAALDTYLSTKECPADLGYLRVNGDVWTATTYVQTVATDLAEAGGELCT